MDGLDPCQEQEPRAAQSPFRFLPGRFATINYGNRRDPMALTSHGKVDETGSSIDEAGCLSRCASTAKRLKPAADVDLGVGFAAIMPCVGSTSCFFRPLQNCKFGVAALDYNPAHRIIALDPANFTTINCVDQRRASTTSLNPSAPITLFAAIQASANQAAQLRNNPWCAWRPGLVARSMTCTAPRSPQRAARRGDSRASERWREC